MKRLAIAAVGLALVVLGACNGGGPADLTDREISDGELAAMALPQEALGSTYADFTWDYDLSGSESNEDAIDGAFDKEDEAEDVERFGRVKGYGETYSSFAALLRGEGVFIIETGVSLFRDADGASGYLRDDIEDSQRDVGSTSDDVTFEAVELFDPDGIGDEAGGQIATFGVPRASDDERVTFHGTAVGIRRGRIAGYVVVGRFDDEDVRQEATELARKLDERILAVLQGEVEPRPTPKSLSLSEYLVLTLAVDADMNRANADVAEAMPDPQTDPEAYVEAAPELERHLSQVAGEALEALSKLTPPAEAQDYHVWLLMTLGDFEETAGELGAAIEANDSSRQSAAERRLMGVVSDMSNVAVQGQQLAITALEAQEDDPLRSYLIVAAQARLEFATVFADITAELQELLAAPHTEEDSSTLFSVFEQLIGRLEDFERRWQQLSPPPKAQQLHERQLELIVETIAFERAVVDSLAIEDEDARLAAELAALSSIEPIAVKGSRLQADWDELLREALSR